MRGIVLGLMVGVSLAVAAGAQQPPADAVAIVLSVRDNALAAMDLSFPKVLNQPELDESLRQIERWTGWTLGQAALVNSSGGSSCQVAITAGGIIEGSLSDTIWGLVAALAPHGRIGIAVIGAPVTTAPMTLENRYVRMEQSGGQGVQSYQVQIKEPGFRNLDELRQPSAAPGGQERSPRRALGLGMAWVLLLVAAVAVGFAFYYIARWAMAPTSRTGGRRRR